MAKDSKKGKGAKPEKSSKGKAAEPVKSKAGKGAKPAKADGFAKPSEAPATGGDGWKFETEDNLGKLFLITPLREKEIEDKFSKKPGAVKVIIEADIVEINEKKPAKSEVHEEVWVFGGYTKGALRGYIGERQVLGRLSQGEEDRGNIPWTLDDADDDDIEIALAYKATVDPFKTGSADKVAKSKDKGGKKGKGK